MLSVDLYHFHFHFCESKLSLWMEKSFSLVEASIFASHFHVLVNEPLDLDSGIHLGWTVLESSNEDRKGLFTTWTVSTISFRWLSCWWTGLKPFDAVILQWTNPEWTPSGVGVRSQNMDELLARLWRSRMNSWMKAGVHLGWYTIHN